MASGRPQFLHPTEDDLPLRFCILPFGHYGPHRWESPAPAAPGVELDFEKADADSREEGSTWTSGYAQRYRKALNAQVRALIDAAVSKAREEERERGAALVAAAERWHELWAQDQRYTIWENTPEGQATHWAVSEGECAEFASDAFDCDKMRDDLAEAERTLINAYETAKYGKSTSDKVSEALWRMLS